MRRTLRKRKALSNMLAQDWIAFNVPDEEEEALRIQRMYQDEEEGEEYLEQAPEYLEQAPESPEQSPESQESVDLADDWENYIEIPASQNLALALSGDDEPQQDGENMFQSPMSSPKVEVKLDVKVEEYLSQLPRLAPSNDAVADRDFKITLSFRLNLLLLSNHFG